jgi:putative FmdB family regulatory protein
VLTYEYVCEKCKRTFEVRQRISAAPLTSCEVCGGTVRRLLSPTPFILKGGGWYVTDYPSESRKKAIAAEKPASTTSDSKTSDSKAAPKPDAKSSTPPSGPPTSSSSSGA